MTEFQRIQHALAFIDPTDRDTWVRMSMAVKNGLGESGFDIWNDWSQRAESYLASDARSVWRSAKAFGGITVATLYFEARANGWCDETPPISLEAEAEAKRKANAQHAADEAALAILRLRAAISAADIWEKAVPATADHDYLKAKGIQPNGTRQRGSQLLVPVLVNNKLTSLQMINPDGKKLFMKDGATRAGYFLLGNTVGAEVLCIAEGFATAATIYEATGLPTVTAFNATNLQPVAQAIRRKYPDHALVICGDDDRGTAGNPGRTKAQLAAIAVGAIAVFPFFSDLAKSGSDFNDLARAEGLQAVSRIIEPVSAALLGRN